MQGFLIISSGNSKENVQNNNAKFLFLGFCSWGTG
jgi:hypothetical protein